MSEEIISENICLPQWFMDMRIDVGINKLVGRKATGKDEGKVAKSTWQA